jgi:alpha-mannosidase
MDAMIEYMNLKYPEEYHFVYSTPSQYIDALAKHNVSWPTKYDDMFPYSDGSDAYWTGYFTSRANDKGYTRRGSHYYHALTQLYTEKMMDRNATDNQINDLLNGHYMMMDAMGIN